MAETGYRQHPGPESRPAELETLLEMEARLGREDAPDRGRARQDDLQGDPAASPCPEERHSVPSPDIDALGLPAEGLPEVDLATLLAEQAALRAAVRAETEAARAQRVALTDALALMRQELERAEARAGRARQEVASLRTQADRQVALALVDLRDRLEPALRAARQLASPPSPGRFQALVMRAGRLLSSLSPGSHEEALAGLASGLELTLERLDVRLRELGVEPVVTLGRPFDPAAMRAVGTVEGEQAEDGEVVEEVTRGYIGGQGVLRLAEVVVCRR